MKHISVGILGATGSVGQRFISLLENHPWFVIKKLGASYRNESKVYRESVNWTISSPMPEAASNISIVACKPENFNDVDLVFSALDASVAGEIELSFAQAGIPVFSNAKNHRYDPDVPILIPFVNEDHISLIATQNTYKTSKGFIITNANCASTGLAIALAPILKASYKIKTLCVTTLQAVSGAGYPGISSLDILDNVIPYISGEEEKLEFEPKKILGLMNQNKSIIENSMCITAMCHRVPVIDGHLLSVAVELDQDSKNLTPEELTNLIQNYKLSNRIQKLPSCPQYPLIVSDKSDRPQPRKDRDAGNGMTTVVGRIRKCNAFSFKFTLCSHNTIIGAAGGSILNAELAVALNYIQHKN